MLIFPFSNYFNCLRNHLQRSVSTFFVICYFHLDSKDDSEQTEKSRLDLIAKLFETAAIQYLDLESVKYIFSKSSFLK